MNFNLPFRKKTLTTIIFIIEFTKQTLCDIFQLIDGMRPGLY